MSYMQILLRTEIPPPQEAEQLLHVSQRDQVGQFCAYEQFNQEKQARISVSICSLPSQKCVPLEIFLWLFIRFSGAVFTDVISRLAI